MAKIPGGKPTEEPRFRSAATVADGLYLLTIATATIMDPPEGVAMKLKLEFKPSEQVPFSINTMFFIREGKDGKKGNVFILNELLVAAGVNVRSDGSFNLEDLKGKTVMVYLFRGASTFMECFNRVFPADLNNPEYTSGLTSLYKRELERGFIKLYDSSAPSPRKTAGTGSPGSSDDGPDDDDEDDDDTAF